LLLLVVTVGVGRGSIDPGWARWPRYTTLTAPVLVLTCVVLRTCASGAFQKIIGVPVLVVLLLMIPPNTRSAIEAGTERADLFERIRADAIDGTPVDVLTSRYAREINPLMRTRATFERMRTHHVGPWRGKTAAPARPVPELLDPIPLDPPVQPTPGPVEFILPDGQHLWAIRWTGRVTTASSSRAWVRVNWTGSRGPRDQIVQVYPRLTAQTIWLDDVVDRITLTPVDAGTVLQIESAQCLTGRRGQP